MPPLRYPLSARETRHGKHADYLRLTLFRPALPQRHTRLVVASQATATVYTTPYDNQPAHTLRPCSYFVASFTPRSCHLLPSHKANERVSCYQKAQWCPEERRVQGESEQTILSVVATVFLNTILHCDRYLLLHVCSLR